MRTIPGFTADESLFRSDRRYASSWHGGRLSKVAHVSPQGECCDRSCPNECICYQGVGKCGPAEME